RLSLSARCLCLQWVESGHKAPGIYPLAPRKARGVDNGPMRRIIRLCGRVALFLWRRASDLNTFLWIFPGVAALVAAALSIAQRLPLALLFVFTLSAFLIVLVGVILWREH